MIHVSPQQFIVIPFKSRSRRIIEWCARRYGVRAAEIVGRSHLKSIVRVRMIAVGLVWRHPETRNMTFSQIGRAFGGRHYSTIMSAVLKHSSTERFIRDGERRAAFKSETRAVTDRIVAREKAKAAWAAGRAERRAKAERRAAERAAITEEAVLRVIGYGQTRARAAEAMGFTAHHIGDLVGGVIDKAEAGDRASRSLLSRAMGRDIELCLPPLIVQRRAAKAKARGSK